VRAYPSIHQLTLALGMIGARGRVTLFTLPDDNQFLATDRPFQ